ncbi:MAG: helix-turn-helix domain-containing protein [Intestinibacillus sp.]
MMKMLEILIAHPGWVTIGDLAAYLEISERTISEDIACLRRRWGPILNLEVSSKKGMKAHHLNTASMGKVFMDLFNESTALRWLEEILFFPHNGIEFYEQKLFASKSTLMRLLPRINRFLTAHGMAIQHKNNIYEFTASDEQFLRQFFACFLLELSGPSLKKYHIDFDTTTVQNIIERILKQNLDPLYASFILNDSIGVLFQRMLYTVSLVRENQGYTLPSSRSAGREIGSKELAGIQGHFPQISEENLRPIHAFLLLQYCGWDSGAEKDLAARETERFFDRIFGYLGTVPDADTRRCLGYALKSLYLCAKYRPFPTSVLFDRVSYFSTALKRHNAPVYRVFKSNLQRFSENVGLDMSPHLNDVLFWACSCYPAISMFTPAKTALVISDFGTPHANYLVELISLFFNQEHRVKISVTPARFPEILWSFAPDGYDIIITTIPNLPFTHPNIVLVNDYPSDENLFDLYKAITAI